MLNDLIELLRLAGPVVLSRLGIMVMGLTDAIVVGHFSARQLGFHAMAWAPTSVFVTATVGLLVGVQVMTLAPSGPASGMRPAPCCGGASAMPSGWG